MTASVRTRTHLHMHAHTRTHMSVNYVIEGDRRSLPSSDVQKQSFAHAHTCTCTHTHALFNRDKGSLNISIQTRRGALISSEGKHLHVHTHVHATTNDAEGKSEGKTPEFESSPPSPGGNHLLTLPPSACLKVTNHFRPSCTTLAPVVQLVHLTPQVPIDH